jgi:hypothetical protein
VRRGHGVAWIVGGVLALVCGAIVWSSVADDEARQTVPGFDVRLTDADRVATTLIEGTDWVLERPDDGAAEPCARLRIGNRATTCMYMGSSVGSGWTGVWRRPGGGAFVWIAGDPTSTVRLYTSGRSGEVIAPVVVDGPSGAGGFVVVELGAGEEPWGVQVLDAEGDLTSTTSLLGWLG